MQLKQHACLTILTLALLPLTALAQKAPPQAEWDKATADVTGMDAAAIDAAALKIRGWVAGGWVSRDLWATWVPALTKAGRHQDVADLAVLGVLGRPIPESIMTLYDARVQSLLALGRPHEALAAAKSYYNACDLTMTGHAVDLVAQSLAKAHPEDAGIADRFKAEQTQASGGTVDKTRKPVLQSVQFDVFQRLSYDAAVKIWSAKNTRFTDRVAYGHLLLVADKSADAEKLFRDLYQVATTQDELTQATEGIAKAIRAQDGNLARANKWLAALPKQTLPTTAPATRP